MAYADLGAISPGDLGQSVWANQVRANFQAGVPDIFSAKGDLAGATGPNAAARLAIGADDAILVPDSGESTGLAWQIQPAVRVYNSGNIDPATSSWVVLTFDSERFDTDAMHSVVSNTGRLTVPANGDGLYLIGGCIEVEPTGGSGTHCGLRIQLNGATVIAQFLDEITIAGRSFAWSLTTLYALSATDYVTLEVFTDRDLDVEQVSNYSPEFWAIWQRRA